MSNWKSEDAPLSVSSHPTGLPAYKYTRRDWIRARWFYIKRRLRGN